jgi:uncharacterized membrane protein YgcG
MKNFIYLFFLTLNVLNTACAQVREKETVPNLEISINKSYYNKLLKLQKQYDSVYKRDPGFKWFYADSALWISDKFQFPAKPLGWTNDFEFVFTTSQIKTLDSIIANYEKETTNEIAIITIDSSWTTKEKFDNLVLAVHNAWGVGKKDKNNGIVIGISVGLKKIRINNGYGIEPKLSDSATKEIIDNIITPHFRQSNYFEGVKQGLLTIVSRVR